MNERGPEEDAQVEDRESRAPSSSTGGGREETATGLESESWMADRSGELRRRSVRSGVVQLGAQPIKVALFAASGMVLARLLTPADFGIFAMAMTWIALPMSIQDFGFPAAVLHGDSIDDDQLSGLFWTNLWLTVGMVAVTVAVAPLVAWFYGEAVVAPVTLAMAVGLLVGSLGWQHRSLLMRQLRFHRVAVVDTSAVAVSVLVSVAAAVLGAGYWALVIQFIVQGATRTCGLWLSMRWRPLPRSRLDPDRTRMSSFLKYGGQFTITRIVRHVGSNMDRILVAAVGGARPAGLYDNAYRWSHYPVGHVFQPLLNVAVSSLSRARASSARYVAAVQDGMLPVLSFVLPMLAFLAFEAERVIPLVLGEQWVDSVPLFRLLALAGAGKSLTSITRWLYLSEGRTGRQLQWALVDSALTIVAVAVGVWLGGAFGVAAAFMTIKWLLAGPEVAFCLAGSPMTGRAYLAGVWRPLVATLAAVGLLLAFNTLVSGPTRGNGAVAAVGIRLAAFSAAYVAVWLGLPGRRRAVGRVVRLVADLRS